MIKGVVTYSVMNPNEDYLAIDGFDFDIPKKIEDFEELEDLKEVIKTHLNIKYGFENIKSKDINIINLLYFTNKNF